MEKVLALLLIGCVQLPSPGSAAYVIGIVYDEDAPPSSLLPAVVSHLKESYASATNATVVLKGVTIDQPNITVCELLASNTVALVVVGTCHFQSFLSMSLQSSLPFPHIRVPVSEPCPASPTERDEFTMSMRHAWLPEVVSELCHHLDFSHLILVYSDKHEKMAVRLSAYLSTKHKETAIVPVLQYLHPDVSFSLHSQWIDSNVSTPVLVIVTRSDLELLLSQGSRPDYWFAFTGGDEVNLITHSFRPRDYFILPDALPVAATDILDHLQRIPPEEDLIQKVASAGSLLIETVSSISSDSQTDPPTLNNSCGLLSSTAPVVASNISQSLSTNIFDAEGYLRVDKYRILVHKEGEFQTVATWKISSGLTTNTEFTTHSPLAFNSTIRVGTEIAVPFTNKTGNDTWEGFCVDMLEELAFRMGFKYKIIQSEDNLWGSENPDGTWNGLVGMAINNKIDMAIGPISINPERAAVVDFTKPYMESAAGIMMRRFEDTTAKMFRTLMPFTFDVWMILAGFVVIIGIIFGLINRFSPFSQLKVGYEATIEVKVDTEDTHQSTDNNEATSDKDPDERWIGSMLDSAWVVYGSFMEQGAEKFPKSASGRVVLGLWWVFTILITASYTASLAAFLTFSMDQVPINSIYDLAQQSEIKPLVKGGTNLHTLFMKGETDTYRRIRDMMLEAPTIDGNIDGMELVMRGPYALLTDREQLDLLQKRDCSQLVQGNEHFNNNGLAFFVREGSALLEPLSHNMIKLMEAGLIDKWRRKWWSSKDVCTDEEPTSGVQSLELDSTAGPFILYAGSTVLALLILLGERAYKSLWPVCRAMANKKTIEV